MTSSSVPSESAGGYLGTSVQRLKLQKTKKIHEMLGIIAIKRPELDTCNTLDIRSIYSYIARENLECAIYCDPETPVLHVEQLCRIANGALKEGEYIHISRHPNYTKAINELGKSPRDLLAYFEVNIGEIVQDTIVANSHITEFRKQFEIAKTQISYRGS